MSPCGVPMVDVNVGQLPRFNFGSNVVSARSIRMIRISDSPRKDSRTVISFISPDGARLVTHVDT